LDEDNKSKTFLDWSPLDFFFFRLKKKMLTGNLTRRFASLNPLRRKGICEKKKEEEEEGNH